MRVHYLQHVPFEGLAAIGDWLESNNLTHSGTHLYANESLPKPEDLDWLIVLGGPMNIYEDKKYHWLPRERRFINQCIAREKIVLGICLGAQFIADALGARVYKNKYKEIGWYPIQYFQSALETQLFNGFPSEQIVFHWHGDTFDLPKKAIPLAQSKACLNQGFIYSNRIIALQFHLEFTAKSIKDLLDYCRDDIRAGEYIQPEKDILSGDYFSDNIKMLNKVLDVILSINKT
jgi:GMP synthase (glutamine-hydrolysing)